MSVFENTPNSRHAYVSLDNKDHVFLELSTIFSITYKLRTKRK